MGNSYAAINYGNETKFKVISYSGVENVEATGADAPVEYYNLQGVRVNYSNAPAGVYIRRQGKTVDKVVKF